MNPLLDCALQYWEPGIRDPFLMGWLIVVVYCLAAFFALAASQTPGIPVKSGRYERVFWVSVAALLALLAFNKQLDFHTFIIAVGRCHSQTQGWYDARREVQLGILILLVIGMGSFGLWLVWGLRNSLKRMFLPFIGLAAVMGFILLRIMLFFHVYHTHIFGNNSSVSRIFEIIGPVLLILGAYRIIRSQRI